WRYRNAVAATGETRLGRLTTFVGVGYFFVWSAFGICIFPIGAALTAIEMQQPALARVVPIVVGVVVVIAGGVQFTGWKARRLDRCTETPARGRISPATMGTAWRYGLRAGLFCISCCAGLTIILLALGVMNPWAMLVVTAAIT